MPTTVWGFSACSVNGVLVIDFIALQNLMLGEQLLSVHISEDSKTVPGSFFLCHVAMEIKS